MPRAQLSSRNHKSAIQLIFSSAPGICFPMGISSHDNNLSWWRRWGKETAIAASAFVLLLLLLLALSATYNSWSLRWGRPFASHSDAPNLVPLTLVRNAKARGAVCLDGSSPGYHFRKGSSSGSNKWVLHVEGGGWCKSVEDCSYRKTTALGSSKSMGQFAFSGMLSQDQSENPDFFNWNKVLVRYCDGASFSGLVENKIENENNIFFRGQLIWEAVMDELLAMGLSNASEVLLSGCSAGGLATLLHCDTFRDLLPKATTVKCLADAGFFLDEKDISGKRTMRSFYKDVVSLQGVNNSLPKDCTSRMEPYKCFFPREIIRNLKTPVFLVNPAYDYWQIQNILAPGDADADHQWLACKQNIQDCKPNQMERLQEYRAAMLNALSEFQQNKEGGLFINSCFTHCQTLYSPTWHSPQSPRIYDRTIAESVGDWFFERSEAKEVDCSYPCNPTCSNVVLN